MYFRSNSLTMRCRLAAIILFAALPAASLFIYESWESYQRAYEDAGRNLLEIAQLLANNERDVARGANDLLTAISETQFIQSRDMLSCNIYLEKINRRYQHYHAFMVADMQGNTVCSGTHHLAENRVIDPSHFKQALQDKHFAVSGYAVNRLTKKPGVAFVQPIFTRGLEHEAIVGVMSTTVSLGAFSSLTRGLGVPMGAKVFIVDAQGVVLATEPERPQRVGKVIASEALRASLFSDKPHVIEVDDMNGVTQLFAIVPATFNGRAVFYAIIGLEKYGLVAPALKTLLFNLGTLFLLALLSLIGTWILSKRLLIRPVAQIIEAANQVASGNLEARAQLKGSTGELSELARHFNTMTEALARRDREMRASNEYIDYLAHHDELTKLPNRRFLLKRLAQSLEESKLAGQLIAVLFIDLDRFRIINDSLGHAAGDILLVDVARRLQECVEAKDMVAHLGSDEFVCVLSGLATSSQAAAMAHTIRERLCQTYMVTSQEVTLGASIGICVCPSDCADAPTAVQYAEVAMRSAKESHGGVQIFSREISAGAINRLTLENELRKAMQMQEFILYYQPQIDLASNHVVGAETLIRWQHPEKGLLSPLNFIALAEETRLILEIGAWALNTACLQNRAWQDAGLDVVKLAVNVSAHQFRHPGFSAVVADALEKSGLPAHLLELEVTESVLLNDVNHSLILLRDMGVSLSIDDFGTGYSSLSYLKDLPIDKLKIDQSFIRNLMDTPDNQAITRAIIGLAKILNLKVVAEGVDSVQTYDFLRQLGCDQIQGFYFGKPMPAEQFALLLKKNHQARESIDGNSLAPL